MLESVTDTRTVDVYSVISVSQEYMGPGAVFVDLKILHSLC